MDELAIPLHWRMAAVLVASLAAVLAAPHIFGRFAILQITIFLVGAILAESLALVWGFCGVMCFGQTAFFGLGGYAYAVAAENMSSSGVPILLSIAIPAAAAVLLGYFMFFGRLGDVFVGVITLCVSLILFDFGNSTQDPFYKIGHAALNGFNGMAGIPAISDPLDPHLALGTTAVFYLSAGSLISIYLLCRLLLASPLGRVAVAVRQNETRAELIGYNAAAVKTVIFVIGAGIAGYAGCLFANWNGFISPGVFGLPMMAQLIIWVVVGGLGTLIGPILAAIGLQYFVTVLGDSALGDVNLVLGLLLMAIVVFLPQGIAPTILRKFRTFAPLRGHRAPAARQGDDSRQRRDTAAG